MIILLIVGCTYSIKAWKTKDEKKRKLYLAITMGFVLSLLSLAYI